MTESLTDGSEGLKAPSAEQLFIQAVAERAWKNGYLVIAAAALAAGKDVRQYIEPAWLKKKGY